MDINQVDLDALPVDKGFRLRGLEMTRLETFVDAAFAFAITLLVVSVGEIPGNYPELVRALKATPSFLASFTLIMLIWAGHRRWSRRFGLEDPVTTLLSLGLVFVMLVYVFPLRLMTSAFFGWVSGGYFPSEFELQRAAELPGLFVIYGVGSFAVSLALALLYTRAKVARELQLDTIETILTNEEIISWMTVAATGLASALFAWQMPPRIGVWAGFFYSTLALSMPLISVRYRRKVIQLQRTGAGKADS